ncbi:MAG TPA: DMT family transporter [Candidatus Angelobacter sp.]|nr:DMT family transporter [Candidatus Angelobacter sp.]
MVAARADALKRAVIANLGLLFMVVIWGAMFPALERILRSWDVFSATAGRHTLAVIALLIVLSMRERAIPVQRGMPWVRLLLLGFFGMTVTALLTTLSVQLSSGASAAIASATNPITSAITARLLHRVPLIPGIVVGSVLSTAGGLIAILGDDNAAMELRGGELLLILANVLWTWYSMMAQRWLAGYSQLHISALTALTGLIGLYAVIAAVGVTGMADFHVDLSPEPVLLMMFAGGISIAIGNSLWHFGVSRVGVTIAAMYSNLIPVVAVAISFWAGTRPTAAQLVGAAVIIAGVLYAQMMALRRQSAQAAAVEA